MTTSAPPEGAQEAARPKVTLLLPLIFVAGLIVFLFTALRSGDPSRLPSVLIGKPMPEFSLPGIPNVLGDFGPATGLSSATFKAGKASVLNFWASWCAPCLAEHEQLIELSQKGIPLYSINYKDRPEAARRFLSSHGNPFRSIGADSDGFVGIDFGITGVPETFIVDGTGRVTYRYQGPITPEILESKILPEIQKAEAASGQPRS